MALPSRHPLARPHRALQAVTLVLLAAALTLSLPGLSLADPPVKTVPRPPAAKIPFNATKVKPGAEAAARPSGTPVGAASEKRPKAEPFRFEGEELYFSVEVSGTDAARASVRVGKRQTVRGVTYVPVAANAITHGFFAKSYPVDNKADTFIDVGTLQPIKSDKFIKEKDEERTYKVRYNPKTFTATVDRELGKGKQAEKRTFDRAVPSTIHDGISWMYELRLMPLKKGDVYTFYIYDGWKLSRLKATVVGNEKAWTPIQEYDAIKVDIEREVLNSRWPKGTRNRTNPSLSRREKPYYFATVHLSADPQHIPVRIFVTSSKADSDLKLVKYVPGK